MTNTTTSAQRRSGRAGDPSVAPVHGAAPRAERAPIVDDETLALDGLVIDIEQLGAFDIGKRPPPAAESSSDV